MLSMELSIHFVLKQALWRNKEQDNNCKTCEVHTGMPNWEERCVISVTCVDVAPANNSPIQESFQCPKNLKHIKQKVGRDRALILLWIITWPFCALNSCPTCPCAMGPGRPNAPLAMDCFRSLPYCNALTREAPLRREEKAQRASDHYHREKFL